MLGTSLVLSVSPTCSNYALQRTAQDNKDSFPLEAEVVERNFYMDDLFKSVPSLLETCSLQAGLVNLLSLGGFRLTKWISNDKNLLTAIPAELQAQSVQTIGEEDILPTERALGVIWDVQKDAFLFKIKPKELTDTGLKVISLTASIFHPIGFLAPFVVRAKIFLQSLWKLRQGWDEKVPEENQQEWSVWQKELQSRAEFSVPQFYRLFMVSPTSIQLHLFRGMPVAYHGKNPVGFVSHCRGKLQS